MKTIAAIATALGSSGVSIIRISGKDSLNIVSKIFNNSSKLKPNNIIYGKLSYKEEFLDNVLVSYFKSPNSFTGEDVCEINCHGGTQITKKILEIVLKNGAYLSEPGEFTKRAFINGKLDLSEAESIIDLINAKTDLESKLATNKLDGKLFYEIDELRNNIVELLAKIEVSIDYPEYDYDDITNEEIELFLDKQIDKINKLYKSYEVGKYIKNGVNVGIFGRPNAGKSSILNALAKKDRAIVTEIEGTTRDVIEERINIGNLILNISDTAGIRDTEDKIEKIGVNKSINKLDEVDLAIYVLDNEKKITKEDKNMLSKIQNKGIKSIYVINKVDSKEKSKFDLFVEELKGFDVKNIIEISAIQNLGIEKMQNMIKEIFLKNEINSYTENIIVSERQKDLLYKSLNLLKEIKKELNKDLPIDIIQIKLRDSVDKLGEIVGNNISEDIIKEIFSKFCLGK